jgi:Fe-S oxidoreductase
MNKENKVKSLDELEVKINSLTEEDIKRVLDVFNEKLDFEKSVYLNSCVHCGLCADSCHYYLADNDIKSIPAYKVKLISQVYNWYNSFLGRAFVNLKDAKELNNAMIQEWVDTLYGRCTLCGRCAINCSIGLNITDLIRMARGALSAIGLIPDGLNSTIQKAVEKGNNMGIPKESWLDTLQWIQEELQDELQDEDFIMPIDKEGANLFYTVNPREPMFFPMSISAAAKIFYAANESWTFSSDNYDVTNYGLYSGQDEIAGMLSERLIESMQKLKCKTLVLAECGHGFNSNRWEAPEWLKKKYNFEVKSILEIIVQYIKEGRIKLDLSLNSKPVTLHDPCNLVRLGGIIEEQRFILKNAVSNFIEMIPNREKNYCCGGGGGQLAMTRFSERRIRAGKIKAEQIKATGAKIVATPCHNCIDQLMELNKHYKLNVEIKTISEIVADALIIEHRQGTK